MSEKVWSQLTRSHVDELTLRVLREAWQMRPEVRLISFEGQRAVTKDYGSGGTWFKKLTGMYLARREATALRRAEDIPNVPRVLAMPDACMVAMTCVTGTSASAADPSVFDEHFFDRLTVLIARLHARGIAHGDLEKLDNILVTPEGEPALVDFASAILSGANPIAALVLPNIMDNDRRAIYKLKAQHAPSLLTPAQERVLNTRGGAEIAFRHLRDHVRSAAKVLSVGRNGDRPPD